MGNRESRVSLENGKKRSGGDHEVAAAVRDYATKLIRDSEHPFR
jgi:hypothetical protein